MSAHEEKSLEAVCKGKREIDILGMINCSEFQVDELVGYRQAPVHRRPM